MDADRVFSSGSGARSAAERGGLPAPLDGDIIPPRGRKRRDADDVTPPVGPAPSLRRPGAILVAAIAASLIGVGAAGGYYAWVRAGEPDATVAALGQLQHDVGSLRSGVDTLKGSVETARQDEAIRSLKKSVDMLKAELDQARNANAAALGQLNTKIDKAGNDPAPKLADIASRLDRIERQVSSPTPTGTIAAPTKPQLTPQPQSTVPPSLPTPAADKSQPKPATLGSWVVRDVYDGIALVEGRSGGIREVTPGEFLPGAGEVRSIQRRGRNWIVVTSRGIIDDSTW